MPNWSEPPAERHCDTGLSLVEVMVAMAVFVVGSLSLLSVFATSGGSTFDNRARLTAANLAASDIDLARSKGYYELTNADYTRDVDGRTYTVRRRVLPADPTVVSGSSSCVASGSGRPLAMRVSTSVSTDVRGNTKPARADTLVKAPVFDPNSGLGAIGFLVLNRAGTPLKDLPISIPGINRTTDVNGCAFFDGLTPNTYTVTVSRTNSVTRDGRTPLTKDVVVSRGQITSDSMRIDTGISVTVKAKAYSGTSPAPSPDTGAWYMPLQKGLLTSPDRATSTAITHSDRKTLTGSDLVWTAYPSPAGYEAHIGRCSVKARFDSEPSTSPSFDLPFSPVTVHLKSGTKNSLTDYKVQSKSVTATWVPAAGAPACTEVLTWNRVTSSGCSGIADLPGNSCRLHLAVPEGRWTFAVSEVNGGASAYTGSTTAPVPLRAAPPTVEIAVT